MTYNVTADYASQNFEEIIHRADTESAGVTIVKENKSYVLIDQEELEALRETAELLQTPNILEDIEKSWIAENDAVPVGNGDDKEKWTQPIDAKALITPEEQANYDNPANDEMAKIKVMKNVARRVEAEILKVLEARGLQMQIRFNPKLKEEGLLDLK